MTKISAVIITFNEERNIARCIESVIPVADEIVVVDSNSTDATQEICSRYNVKFVLHAFEGYIKQKNWAITQASNPYVLSLDADEALSPELQQSILAIKEDITADGYSFNRLTNHCGTWVKHTGWYPDAKLRLWNSQKGEWKGEDPHDRYEMQKGSKTAHLKGDLLHYSYYTLSQHLNQINKFTGIAAKERFAKNKKVSIVKLLFHPIVTFIRKYFFKLGFLDGYTGFVISVLTAYGSFLKDIQLRELHKNSRNAK